MNTSSPPKPFSSPQEPWLMPVSPVAPIVPASPPNGGHSKTNPDATPLGAPVTETTHSKRRDKVLYVRVNSDEKEQIVSQAHDCRLSISRYLTRFAMEKRPPPSEEDRRRLETLLLFFKRAEINVRRLHTEASRMRLFSALPGMEQDFEATLETVNTLIRELGKRLK